MAGPRRYDESHGSGKRFPGQLLLKPRSKLVHYNMSYSKGKTLFRPWGNLLADGTMESWRDNEGKFGFWIVQDDVCTAWGKDKKFTVFTRCDDESNWQTGSPLQLLWDEVRYSAQFKNLTERIGNSWPVISAPRHSGIVKGLLVEMNGKSYAQRPIWGTMLVLPPSAREAFDDLLNVEADVKNPAQASADDPYGWNSKYYVGDPIGLTCGKLFEFDKESNIYGASSGDINVAADGRASSRTSDSPIEKYGCRMYPSKPVLPLPIDKVKKYDESFVDALWFMTGEEQIVNVIIPGFGYSHKNLVTYVFGNKGVLPASYEFGRTTVDMGKAGPPQGQPTVAPQASSAPAEPEINLDADNDELPPEEDAGEAPSNPRNASQPVFVPPAQPVQAAPKPVGGTADSIRQRLAAASGKGQSAQPSA